MGAACRNPAGVPGPLGVQDDSAHRLRKNKTFPEEPHLLLFRGEPDVMIRGPEPLPD